MKQMKAAVLKQYGADEKLQLSTQPIPEPRDGEVLIKVKAAGVNPVDWKIRGGYMEGRFPVEFPLILGWDVAGEIAGRGLGARRFELGDRVFAYARKSVIRHGAYAEYMVVPESYLARIPENLDFAKAAAVPLASQTAYQALFVSGQLQAGQTVLILGASGGVGSYAVQLAKIKGATVAALAGTANQAYMKDLGADFVFDYKDPGYPAKIREQFPNGIDLVFDCYGFETAEQSVDFIKAGGRMVSIAHRGPGLKGRDIHFHYHFVDPNARQLEEIAGYLADGKMKVNVTATYPLEQAEEAHQQIRTFHTQGKIVLLME